MTWQEIKLIVEIADSALGQFGSRSWLASEEDYYTEVLDRYNKAKMALENTEFDFGHSVLDYEL